MKALALFAVAVLIAAAFWYQARPPSGSAQTLNQEVVAESEAALRSHELPSPVQAGASSEDARPTERSAVQLAGTSEEDLASGSETAAGELECRVILVESSGVEFSTLNGSIELHCWQENFASTRSLQVIDGTFKLDASDFESVTVSDLELSGRAAQLLDPDQQYFLTESSIVIRVAWTKSIHLSVVDSTSGEHLGDITLSARHEWLNDTYLHPGRVREGSARISGGFSPIEIRPSTAEAKQNSATFLIHSPGYAWKRVHLNLTAGGEREIRLTAGGGLVVRVIGEQRQFGAGLLLLPGHGQHEHPIAEFIKKTRGEWELDSLEPGKYRASMQVGKWYSNPLVLGELDLEVVSAEEKHYELLLAPLEETIRAKLAGTLLVPAAWNLGDFELNADFVGTPTDGSEGSHSLRRSLMQKGKVQDSWAFDFGEVDCGDYVLEFQAGNYPSKLEYEFRASVGPGGSWDLRLEIPPPADVRLRLLDGKSGEIADVQSILWGPINPAQGYTSHMVSAMLRAEDGLFAFRAPIGEISMHSFGSEYTTLDEKLQLHAGENAFTFTLHLNCPLMIVFMDGETTVPFNEDWYPTPEHVDGTGTLLFVSQGGEGFETALSEPGQYIFEVPEVPGFEPVSKQTITVVRGEQTTHRIQLKRKL